jgi:ubiquinone/menaquinone biosynthesis C-methylase UbiE
MAASGEMFRGSADVYDRFVGRYGPHLARELIEAAGIQKGWLVLDVGCGPGALTKALADLLGPADVSAVDPSEPFVETCRSRVPGADVRVAPAESLPFDDAAFDAVLSQLVVNFLTDAPQGLAEMRRVSRPGGIVAGCVWDYAGEMTMLNTFWDAAAALDPDGARPLMETHIMRYSRPEELADLWRDSELEDVDVTAIVAEADYDDFDDLWSPFPTGVGPAGAYAAGLAAEEQQALRAEFRRRLGDPAGSFTLSARAWCAVGRVP